MLARLHDPYSEFLPPAAFRRALRRPLPSEQSYLQAQYVGERECGWGERGRGRGSGRKEGEGERE